MRSRKERTKMKTRRRRMTMTTTTTTTTKRQKTRRQVRRIHYGCSKPEMWGIHASKSREKT